MHHKITNNNHKTKTILVAGLLYSFGAFTHATPVNWIFPSPVVFSGTDTLSGSFTFDADTNMASNINLMLNYDGTDYSITEAGEIGAGWIRFVNANTVNSPGVYLSSATLTNAGGDVSISSMGTGLCGHLSAGVCGNINPEEFASNVQISSDAYTVTPSAGANGSISPNTGQLVVNGNTTQFTVTADTGYTANVGGTCGGSLAGTTYTTNAITADCTVEASFAEFNDGDGIDVGTENSAPNNGDGNDDGIPDSEQSDVTSLPAAQGGGYLTMSVGGGCSLAQSVAAVAPSALDPANYSYPLGLLEFSLPCENALVTVYYHGATSLDGHAYRKYGPTTPGAAPSSWYTLPGVVFGTTTIDGQTVSTATFELADNQLGDDTGDDGVIVDQGGPGLPPSAPPMEPIPTPTLSEWTMVILSGLLALMGILTLRRKYL